MYKFTEVGMEIKKYININGLTIGSFATLIGISRGSLSRSLNGKDPFSQRTADLIEHYTGGKVKASELLRKNK